MQKIIEICGGVTRMPDWRMANPVDFELTDSEHVAIVGPNGGGKSMLVDMITGRHPLLKDEVLYDFAPSRKELVSDNIKHITFKDSYGEHDSTYYLQQRWNQQEINENMPQVGQILEQAYMIAGEDSKGRRLWQKHLYDLFGIEALQNKYIILLSSGELRKIKIIKALLSEPRVLIMDNPFIGLDPEARLLLKELFDILAKERAIQIILVLSKTDDIPDFITHVIEVNNMYVHPKITLRDYLTKRHYSPNKLDKAVKDTILQFPYHTKHTNTDIVVQMNDVSIKYGEHTILKNINWTVRSGEHWALTGQNGAGKSTLLSLVCADNPQSYACNIVLFGMSRGSGESIWDIKQRIGYVSPEMHRAYKKNIPTINIVASGLKESVGLYTKTDSNEIDLCLKWMGVFGLKGKEYSPFLKLSSGEQRLALLARAFVKDPELIILDEPLHGLDDNNRQRVREIIDTFCQRENKTLIMVTHYNEELPSCIDHSITLKRNS